MTHGQLQRREKQEEVAKFAPHLAELYRRTKQIEAAAAEMAALLESVAASVPSADERT